MLVSFERPACKLCVRGVPGTDHHQVYVFIVKHFVGARHCLRESKSLADVMRRNTRCGRDRAKVDTFGLEVWQQHRRYVTTRSNDAQNNRLRRLSQRRWTKRDFPYDLCLRIVIEHDAKIWLLNVSGNQL